MKYPKGGCSWYLSQKWRNWLTFWMKIAILRSWSVVPNKWKPKYKQRWSIDLGWTQSGWKKRSNFVFKIGDFQYILLFNHLNLLPTCRSFFGRKHRLHSYFALFYFPFHIQQRKCSLLPTLCTQSMTSSALFWSLHLSPFLLPRIRKKATNFQSIPQLLKWKWGWETIKSPLLLCPNRSNLYAPSLPLFPKEKFQSID